MPERVSRPHARVLTCVLWPLLLAGCGGGGGGGGTGSANTPPTFTSATAVSVAENTAGTVYTATASDAQGQAVTFSISGGADATRFAIAAGGALSFAGAPNFEVATDANGDNVYEVTLAASDGSLSTTLNLTVTVTNTKEGVQVRRIATGFNRPSAVSIIPGQSSIYVAEKSGAIYQVDPANGSRQLVITIPVSVAGDQGITAIAAAYDYPSTRLFYILYSAPNGDVKLTRYFHNANGFVFVSLVDVTIGSHAAGTNNYGGWIGSFDAKDVYVATGDGGGSRDPGGSAQSSGSYLGKLLRFNGAFDPYAGAGPAPYPAPVIVASGLHNPSGGDLVTGGIYLTDRGQDMFEEVNLFTFPMPNGGWGNYGWPFKEGTQAIATSPPAGLVDPVTQYARGTDARAGQAIMGGVNYRGSIASLAGSFLMIDASGKIFTIPANRLVAGSTLPSSNYQVRTLDFVPDVGTIDRPVAITEDAVGNVYILDDDGEVFRLSANGT